MTIFVSTIIRLLSKGTLIQHSIFRCYPSIVTIIVPELAQIV